MSQWAVERPDFLWLLLLAVPVIALAVTSRRQIPRGRMIMATTLRLVLLLVLTLALAGLMRKEPVDALGVVFVLDRSASVPARQQARALDFVKQALSHQGAKDQAGVVVFGQDALVEIEPVEALRLDGIESTPVPHQSDLAAGLRLASALLPADRARRIVLLTDGHETVGDAASQVLLTAGDDLEIAVVPLTTSEGAEIWLADLLAPARVDEGAAYEIKVVAQSDVPTRGTLRLYRNDTYLGALDLDLEGGRGQVFAFRQEASESGLYRYRAVLEPSDPALDAMPQNNEVVATVQVTGRPRVLYSEGYPDQAHYLADALRGEGLAVDVVAPENLPSGPSGLRAYDAVILSDVPAYLLSLRQQEALRAYVRDLGRGLVMVGGDRSFGLGGYYKTPVEQALPVGMDIQDKTHFPKLGMVIAMDKSCSMGGGAGSKLAVAKEAGIQTAELLSDRDLLGVIGFDDSASWIVPLTPMVDREQVIETIAAVRVGGGTDIYPALDRAQKGLQATDAALKHIILLSDGMTAGGDFDGLIGRARADEITLTTVAIGSDADRATMQDFARAGGGNYYLVTDISGIPAIFTRETLLASRSFLIEEPVGVQRNMPSDLLKGFAESRFPMLGGYVATEAKPRAVVALTTREEHPMPLLAHWHYGLGRSVAYTSDVKSRWSSRWLGTPEYTQFWTQVMRWTVGTQADGALDVAAEIRQGRLVVTVDAFAPDGGFRNFLEGSARVIAPDLSIRELPLRQVAPGRYQATAPVDQDGSWLASVALTQAGTVVGQAVVEAVQPYSPEYRPRGLGASITPELARLGGGGLLTDPAQVFRRPAVARHVPRPWWPPLLGLAALLLLLDVASRRLALAGGPVGALASVTAGSPPRRGFRPRPAHPVATPASAPEPLEEEQGSVVDPPIVDADSYAGRLLAARKSARDKMDKK